MGLEWRRGLHTFVSFEDARARHAHPQRRFATPARADFLVGSTPSESYNQFGIGTMEASSPSAGLQRIGELFNAAAYLRGTFSFADRRTPRTGPSAS